MRSVDSHVNYVIRDARIRIIFCLLLLFSGCKENRAPVPATPFSTPAGHVDSTYYFITSAIDPEGDNVFIRINWGDDSISPWSKELGSEEQIKIPHAYKQVGIYKIKAQAKDIHNNESDWTAEYTMKIETKSSPPESIQIVSAPTEAQVNKAQEFFIRAVDLDIDTIIVGSDTTFKTDTIMYRCRFIGFQTDASDSVHKVFDSTSSWSDVLYGIRAGRWPSGETGKVGFTFTDTGTYVVKPQAKDLQGNLSDTSLWRDSCVVRVIPPEPPKRPELSPLAHPTGTLFTQTPYYFRAVLRALIDRDSLITFEYDWDDGETLETPPNYKPNPPEARISHAFKKAGTYNVIVKTKDRWGQYSNPSAPPVAVTLVNNLMEVWNYSYYSYGFVISGDTLWIVDNSNGEIKIMSTINGEIWGTIGSGKLESPMFAAVDEEFLYVTDGSPVFNRGNKVYKFNKTQDTLVLSWGKYGRGKGEFDMPTGITVDDEYVYVMDNNNSRIQKFRKDGTYVADWTCPKSRGILMSGDTLYVASYSDNYVRRFTPNGVIIDLISVNFDGPQSIGVYDNYFYVIETGINARVQKLTKAGTFVAMWGSEGSEDGRFRNACDIAIDESGNIYVNDTGNKRIQKFDGSL